MFRHMQAARSRRQSFQSAGFTLTEILVSVALMMIIMSILIPVLGKARESARYTAWQAMSRSMQSDPRMALYYNFADQAGDEVNAAGNPIVLNKSNGDPMGMVASEQSSFGAQDPELRYSVLLESHPNDDNKGKLPTFEHESERFRGKAAMKFYGVTENPNQSAKEGSYIKPEYWAGVVHNGEFQIAMWINLNPFAKYQKPISWGADLRNGSDAELGQLFSISAPGDTTQLERFRVTADGVSFTEFNHQSVDVFNSEWHFVVARLKKPFGTDGDFADPSIPEMRDVEISVDGSDFLKATEIVGTAQLSMNLAITELVIGKKSKSNGNYIQGYIDEVAIWQEPTDIEEVKKMYRIGAPAGHARSSWY